MTRRILVSGSAGFVGSHLIAALRGQGHRVVGIDLRCGVDARDFYRHNSNHFDAVFHCAAVVGGRKVIDGSPLRLATANLQLDAALFDWAVRAQPGRLVVFSSSAAYPVAYQSAAASRVRLRESDLDPFATVTQAPDGSYGESKVMLERLAGWARADHGLPVTVLRPFTGTGPGQSLDYPIPAICARAAAREDPLTVWSDAVRDIIHIDDVVGAALTLAVQGVDGPVNLCTGVGTSLTDLARIAARAAGYTPEIRVLEGMPTGVAHRVGDPTLLREHYRPQVSVESTVANILAHYPLVAA